jgi:hypothetical protein
MQQLGYIPISKNQAILIRAALESSHFQDENTQVNFSFHNSQNKTMQSKNSLNGLSQRKYFLVATPLAIEKS